MMDNIENNKLIAEFMGGNIDEDSDNSWLENIELPNGETRFHIEQGKYQVSWDWLIPVIEKCREKQIWGSQRLIDNIDKRLLKLDLIATYRNTVDFIEWFNEQKK